MIEKHNPQSSYYARYVLIMSFLGCLYVILACVVFFIPNKLLGFLNFFPNFVGRFESIPVDSHALWIVFAGCFFLITGVTCFLSAVFPAHWGYRVLILLAALLCGTASLVVFGNPGRYFAYLFFAGIQFVVVLVVGWKSLVIAIKHPFRAAIDQFQSRERSLPPLTCEPAKQE